MSGRTSRRSAYGLDTDTAAGPDWAARGLCRQLVARGEAEPDLWFPNVGSKPSDGDDATGKERAAYQQPRTFCARCPVWRECRAYALTNDVKHGMWGGLSPRERRAVLKRTGAA